MRNPRSKVGQKKPDPIFSRTTDFENLSFLHWVVFAIAATMFLAPAMGVPSEELLQDTLKSFIVGFGTLIACLIFFGFKSKDRLQVGIPLIVILPIGLCLYALGSIVWSHTYLATVEAVRWFIFSLLFWLGYNCLSLQRLPMIAWGIHWGVTVASVWTVLQFCFDFGLFPQGPNPASTFVNRNFFAEYAVCAVPFTLYLLTRESRPIFIYAIAASFAVVLSAIFMTGTRSALIALLCLCLFFWVGVKRHGEALASAKWGFGLRYGAVFTVFFGIILLGIIPSQNTQLISELGGGTGLDRAFSRTVSVAKPSEYSEGSFSIRARMWKATGRMIVANPLVGVGAGAWEVQAPRFQEAGTQLEVDFFAHNEFLQLLAEYGLMGWLFILGILTFLLNAAWMSWRNNTELERQEGPLRTFLLASLFAMMIVSNAGFPWHMASTLALFAICLGGLAASTHRIKASVITGRSLPGENVTFALTESGRKALLYGVGVCIALASYVSFMAFICERDLVRAVKLALTVSKSKQANHPNWKSTREEIIALTRAGIAINPHYRKITPMVADELASWGDWRNAVWIWESVLKSRPYVVAIAANISRGYSQLGDQQKSDEYFEIANKIQPTSPAVQSLIVSKLVRQGNYFEAAEVIKSQLDAGHADYELAFAGYLVGMKTQDWQLAIKALETRIKKWPEEALDGWLKLGDLYGKIEGADSDKAFISYKKALDLVAEAQQSSILNKIPEPFRAKLLANL